MPVYNQTQGLAHKLKKGSHYLKQLDFYKHCYITMVFKGNSKNPYIYNQTLGVLMKQRLIKSVPSDKGFSLIEIMVVIVILGILAGLVAPRLMNRTEEAQLVKAKVDIESIITALKLYKLDNGSYPTTEQGLSALIEAPSTEPLPRKYQKGGYLEKGSVPKDPWSNEYIYLSPGVHDDFDIISYGKDKVPGGEEENKDINSWELE